MKKVNLFLMAFFIFSSFDQVNDGVRLIFEEQKSMRSSFCMYNDGKFYESRPSGCVAQEFASGSWERINDTITLIYQTDSPFKFEVLKSSDTAGKYQIVRIVDCYNQPVRFQNVCFDTTCQNLYNPGIIRIEKGKSVFYSAPVFEHDEDNREFLLCNADTITYKWHCNRESIESIDGGSLYINKEPATNKIILKNKKFISIQ